MKFMEALIYNWSNYKVLLRGKYQEKDLSIHLLTRKPKSNKLIQKAIEQQWSDMVKGRKSVGKEAWNSKVFTLVDYKVKNDILNLEIGTTTYKELQGTNATYWLLGEIYGKEYLANAILVESVVFDKDGKFIVGKRNTGVKKEYEPYAIFGGTMDYDDKKGVVIPNGMNPFTAMEIELEEELGITKDDVSDIYINYLVEDRKYYPILFFWTHLNISFEELHEKFLQSGDKTEHSDIVVLSKPEIASILETTPEKAKDIALTAFDLYLKES